MLEWTGAVASAVRTQPAGSESLWKLTAGFVCSSDGEEDKDDDEEVPEDHEPRRQEGRGRQTRV